MNDHEWIQSLFPMRSRMIRTTGGISDGVIFRFRSFYLKVYNTDSTLDEYTIQGFRYYSDNPVFEDCVKRSEMRKYCSQFNVEDFLCRRG